MKFNEAIFVKLINDKAQAKAKKIVDDVLSQLTDELMFLSPVGQDDLWSHSPPEDYVPGKYKANWQHSVGAPKTDVVDARDDKVLEANSPTGIRIKESIKSNKLLYTKHFFRNNVPYAQAIEHGSAIHNPQATSNPGVPLNVAGLTVQNIPIYVSNAKKRAGL